MPLFRLSIANTNAYCATFNLLLHRKIRRLTPDIISMIINPDIMTVLPSLTNFRLSAEKIRAAQTAPGAPLPMSPAEMKKIGWNQADIILVTGDAYVDHPSFGTAIIGRFLQWLGYKVAVISQPDVSDPDCLKILGAPRLFWGVTAGNVDSQLAHLTVMRKRRRDDAYTPGGKAGRRPPNATISYTALARHACSSVPVVIGGIEASLRTFAYYDFWTDKVRRSILADSKAGILVYGMAELALAGLALKLESGESADDIRGIATLVSSDDNATDTCYVPSFAEVSDPSAEGKKAFSRMTALIFSERLKPDGGPTIMQQHDQRWLKVNPPQPPLSTGDLDILYALPFTRKPHPSYGNQEIPAYTMIKDSVTTHRGCCANCSFCAISTHQGVAISSRSRNSIISELTRIVNEPGFKGTITDLGGPTANMYGFYCKAGRNGCPDRNCVYPAICPNLCADHSSLIELMRSARKVKGIKHAFVSSGIRFDLALDAGGKEYIDELAQHHTGGLLKIAPEHISASVLKHMRKPEPLKYRSFVKSFLDASRKAGRNQAVVEYFISGHPGCTLDDMVELALYLRKRQLTPAQVQDFYPAPMTLAASMYYTGSDPLTGEEIYTAKTDAEKSLQRSILLSHEPEFRRKAETGLRKAGRTDLMSKLFS